MHFSVDWMDGWGNDPRFKIHDVEPPAHPGKDVHVWTQRDGIHRFDNGIWCHYFYNDMSGQPTDGFGGSVFEGTFVDGTSFKYVGAWSSRPGCVNRLWPDSKIVGVSTDKMIASAVRAVHLVNWWRENAPDWGLAWCTYKDGESYLQPTRNGTVKNPSYWASIVNLER
jgi:hypothetical protein